MEGESPKQWAIKEDSTDGSVENWDSSDRMNNVSQE